MYAIEFETDISGNTVRIPTHILKNIPKHQHVKIIMLLPEKLNKSLEHNDFKQKALDIMKSYSALPKL